MINAATYASPYHRISKKLKEKMTGSIEGCIKIIIFNITNINYMTNKTKIFSDLSKIAVDAMSTFAGLKKEIETIVILRVNKVINKMKLVKRDEFEVLKKTVQKLANDNEVLKKSIKSNQIKKTRKKTRKKLKNIK